MIPSAALNQHIAILGKTGSGKTFAAKGIVEGLLDARRQVCIIDPTAAWWGLRLGRDGKSKGYDVVLLGGEHGDIPLSERSGEAVAERDTHWRAMLERTRGPLSGMATVLDDVRGRVERAWNASQNGHAATPASPKPILPTARQGVSVPVTAVTVLGEQAARRAERGSDAALGKGERAILTAIAQHPAGVTRKQLTILTGYKRSSRDTFIQRLRAGGWIDFAGDTITAAAGGIALLGADFEPLPTGDALRCYWLDRLTGGERVILDAVCRAHPHGLTRTALSEATDYQRSSRDTFLQRLSARRLIVNTREGVKAANELFGG